MKLPSSASFPTADDRVGVQVKLWSPLRTRAIPERFCGGDSLRRGAVSSSVSVFLVNKLHLTSARIGTSFKFCTNADQISKKYDYRLKKILGAAKVWFFIFIATDITDCRNNSAYRLWNIGTARLRGLSTLQCEIQRRLLVFTSDIWPSLP